MSETAADPRLFRLRAFERDWLAPQSDAGPLAPLLAAEGEQWIALGRRVGYFADMPALGPGLTPEAEAFGARLSAQIDHGAFEDAAAFAARLVEAQEDLTPARRAFLEIVLFSDDAAWRRRLQEGAYLVEALRGPAPLLPDEERLERTAWILEGAVSAIAERDGRSPAHWRSQAPGALAEVWPQAEGRLSMLAELHAALMDAGATLAAREHWETVAARAQTWHRLGASWRRVPEPGLLRELSWEAVEAESPSPLALTHEIAMEIEHERRASFVVEPLQRGLGYTFGNALRRVMLSVLEGPAITSMSVAGVVEGSATIPGVEESLADVGEGLKGLVVRMDPTLRRVDVRLAASGPATVTGRDIELLPGIEILNADAHLATLREGARLDATLTVEWGHGYRPASDAAESGHPGGTLHVDAIFTPVVRVAYAVEPSHAGERADYDKLTLDVETDGSIDPSAALRAAISALISQLGALLDVVDAGLIEARRTTG